MHGVLRPGYGVAGLVMRFTHRGNTDPKGGNSTAGGSSRRRRPRAALMLCVGLLAAYPPAFVLLYPVWDVTTAALAVVPVAAVGWYLGLWPAVTVGLLGFVVNTLLLNLVGEAGRYILLVHGLPGTVGLVVVGAAVGRLSDLRQSLRREAETLKGEVAERRRIEEALAQRTEDLARSNTELEQFAYMASHDLQEPLRMVSSYTQLLAQRYRGKLDADADEFIAYAVDGARRMQRLIEDLLAYSRVDRDGKGFEPTACEAVFDRALASLRVVVDESDAVVTHEALPTVAANGSQLYQLFQNLIGNAIKFRGQEPPRVHVAAQRKVDGWLFSVRDNGIGIAPEHAERIFVMFQRLHTRGEYPGTGMGLAMCKKIVENHGGRIWVESEPGKGATFYFTIPAAGGDQP